MVRRLSDLIKEQEIVVHALSHYPEMNNSIKMEVGIEDCLHIEFEYNKSKLVCDVWCLPSHCCLLYNVQVALMCLAIVSAVMVGGLYLWPALRYGTGYQTV